MAMDPAVLVQVPLLPSCCLRRLATRSRTTSWSWRPSHQLKPCHRWQRPCQMPWLAVAWQQDRQALCSPASPFASPTSPASAAPCSKQPSRKSSTSWRLMHLMPRFVVDGKHCTTSRTWSLRCSTQLCGRLQLCPKVNACNGGSPRSKIPLARQQLGRSTLVDWLERQVCLLTRKGTLISAKHGQRCCPIRRHNSSKLPLHCCA